MFLFKLLRLLFGYVEISAQGFFLERFLNLCARSGINVWNIRKQGAGRLFLCLSVRSFRKLRPAAVRSKTRVHILSRHGVPFFLHRYRRRYALFIGGVLFLALLWVMSAFIWSVEIVGTEALPPETVVESLSELGFGVGSRTAKFDVRMLRQELLLKRPELSWASINIRGSKAVVEVRERVEAPEILDEGEPCNLIASVDGQIEQILALSGEAKVGVGEAVRKGDLLISGVLDSETAGTRLVTARGQVIARTWRKLTAVCPLQREERAPTGRSYARYSLIFLNFRINLYWGSSIPYEYYDKMSNTQEVSIGGNYLPLALVTERFDELTVFIHSRSAEQAEAECRSLIEEKKNAEFSHVSVESEVWDVSVEESQVRVVYELTGTEDIAVVEKISSD